MKKSYFAGSPKSGMVFGPTGLVPIDATSRSAFLLKNTAPVTPFCRCRLAETTELYVSIIPSCRGCTGFCMLRISDRVRFVNVGSTIEGGTFGMKPGTPGGVNVSYVMLQNCRGRLTSVLKNATSEPIVSAICSSSGTCDGSTSFTSK